MLRGVVSQRLLPRAGGGRVAAVEVMVTNERIAELIREDRADEIPDAIADGSFFEMQTFSRALIELVRAGEVGRDVAADAATNRHDFLIELDHALKVDAAASDGTPAAPPVAVPAPELELGGLRVAGRAP